MLDKHSHNRIHLCQPAIFNPLNKHSSPIFSQKPQAKRTITQLLKPPRPPQPLPPSLTLLLPILPTPPTLHPNPLQTLPQLPLAPPPPLPPQKNPHINHQQRLQIRNTIPHKNTPPSLPPQHVPNNPPLIPHRPNPPLLLPIPPPLHSPTPSNPSISFAKISTPPPPPGASPTSALTHALDQFPLTTFTNPSHFPAPLCHPSRNTTSPSAPHPLAASTRSLTDARNATSGARLIVRCGAGGVGGVDVGGVGGEVGGGEVGERGRVGEGRGGWVSWVGRVESKSRRRRWEMGDGGWGGV